VRLYLRDQDPLGKQIRIDVAGATNPWRQIVGVVGNVKSYSESTRDEPEVYEPYLQRPVSSFSIMLRTDLEPGALASAVRSAVSGLDPDLPVAHVMSMPTLLDRQSGGDNFLPVSPQSFMRRSSSRREQWLLRPHAFWSSTWKNRSLRSRTALESRNSMSSRLSENPIVLSV
jgi:hypothetical protein